MNFIVTLLILVSSAASIPLSVKWVKRPETALLYNKAKMPLVYIRWLSVLLGVGGILILLPETFVFGGALLICHVPRNGTHPGPTYRNPLGGGVLLV